MRISRVKIQNFRSVRNLDLTLDETTVLIGANNTGKTAVLEALRIALSRRWGRRGTGFVEFDVHRSAPDADPKTVPSVSIQIELAEPQNEPWDADMAAALDDVIVLSKAGQNLISLRVTCGWNDETEAFEPAWEFLDAAGAPLTGRSQRASNFSSFFDYVPLFYLAALRDATDEFGPRSSLWSRLLKSVRIPDEVEDSVQTSLDSLDEQLLGADPKLAQIAIKISQAAKIAVGQGEGDARLRMLPMNTWDLLSRASVVLKNEQLRPWLPLHHHGQGLQSLSVIFLFQAAASQQLEDERPGTEPVFLLEEPEAHLHPQAARTLWGHISKLPGQRLVTTHSPYFVQHVPLRNLRLVKLVEGRTEVASMPRSVSSELKWNDNVQQLAAHQGRMFVRSPLGMVNSTSWFDSELAENLKGCFKDHADQGWVSSAVDDLRYRCRGLVTEQEEHELSFLGRRIRGEIFFARRWILVEGQSEYVLLHAIGRALGYPLDRHGIAVIDFQNNGDAAVYPALAASFDIPWRMITDGDAEASKFRDQILKRGFRESEVDPLISTLPPPSQLEDQLIKDGHEQLLRTILAEGTSKSALTCQHADFVKRLKNNKIPCISRLALRVEADEQLALQMPAAFVGLVQSLKGEA